MKWKYPLSDIDLGKEEEREVLKVLRSRWLSTGPVTSRFEKGFADFLGGGEAIAVSNGTAALHLAVASLGLKKGDEVILPSFTFVATANAVLYTGAKPVFADIKGWEDLNISPDEIDRQVTRRTRAIIVMHYGGYPCDMDGILNIAKRHGLSVVEDAAHAPGSGYGGRKCGTLGTLGCFSFFSNKNLVTGEGGMVFTRDPELAERVRVLRSHGMKTLSWDKHKGHLSSYDIDTLGYNYRTTEIQSALGLIQLKKLERNNRRRRKIVEAYRKELRGVSEVFIPFLDAEGPYSYHLFPLLIQGDPETRASLLRDELMKRLKDVGIQTSVHYPPIHLFSLYRKQIGCKAGLLPMTEAMSQRVVTLPLHPRMDAADAKWVGRKISEIIRKWS
jgi:dTDP-4-amino-4,6-dideoxygalactose transaminase